MSELGTYYALWRWQQAAREGVNFGHKRLVMAWHRIDPVAGTRVRRQSLSKSPATRRMSKDTSNNNTATTTAIEDAADDDEEEDDHNVTANVSLGLEDADVSIALLFCPHSLKPCSCSISHHLRV